jgi:hypothetical protein
VGEQKAQRVGGGGEAEEEQEEAAVGKKKRCRSGELEMLTGSDGFIIWIVCVVGLGLWNLSLWLRIEQENEEGLPLEERRSFKLFQLRRTPSEVLREHRARYPNAKTIRFWVIFAMCLNVIVVCLPFFIGLLH